MSKFVKNLIMKEITGRFGNVEGVAVISPRGIDATKNNGIRRKLHAKGLKMHVIKNSLAKKALADSKIKGFEVLLEGPSAIIYGAASVPTIARLLMEEKKTNAKLELRGAFFDGDVYIGEDGMKAASKLPTREEAIANLVSLFLSPGKNIGGILKGQADKMGNLIKGVEDAAKKKEESAAAAAPAVA